MSTGSAATTLDHPETARDRSAVAIGQSAVVPDRARAASLADTRGQDYDCFNRELIWSPDRDQNKEVTEVVKDFGLTPKSEKTLLGILARDSTLNEQFLDIARAAGHDEELKSQLTALINLKRPDGQPILLTTDKDGVTLLQNLSELAQRKIGNATERDSELFTGVLQNLANPHQINQGYSNTCAATAMQFKLVSEQPSEYVRILHDLQYTGEVTLRSGLTIHLSEQLKQEVAVGDTARSGGYSARTFDERLFQTAMIDFGRGCYSNLTDHSRTTQFEGEKLAGTYEYSGLHDSEAQERMIALFGGHRRLDVKESLDPSKVSTTEVKQQAFDQIEDVVSRNSLRNLATSEAAYAVEQSVVVSLSWNPPGQNHAYHMLNVVGMDEKYVYLRNPWGQGSGEHQDGMYRMERNDFRDRLRYALIPDAEVTTAEKSARYHSEGGIDEATFNPEAVITFVEGYGAEGHRMILSTDSEITRIYPITFEKMRQELEAMMRSGNQNFVDADADAEEQREMDLHEVNRRMQAHRQREDQDRERRVRPMRIISQGELREIGEE